MAPCPLIVPRMVWRELRSRGKPGATIDSSQLTAWQPMAREPAAIALDEVVRVEWEALGSVGLRLRSGEVRAIKPDLGKRARAEFLAALRSTLAERQRA
jgi:hypothetical protein